MEREFTRREPFHLYRLLVPAILSLAFMQAHVHAAVVSNSATTVSATSQLSAVEAIHNLSLVVQKISAHVAARDLPAVLSYDFISMKSFQFLLYRPALALPEKQAQVKAALVEFSTRLNAARNAARDRNHSLAVTRADELAQAWTKVKEMYPADLMRALSEFSGRYSCPSHTEVTGQKGEVCPRCARPLQPLEQFCGLPPADPITKCSASLDRPLKAGEPARVTLRLTRKDGAPTRPADLLATHTERIHLFAIDPTLSDYHHEHPQPTAIPGEYVFDFTPRIRGGYRLWLDLLPAVTLREEMPSLDLGAVVSSSVSRMVFDQFTNGIWHLRFAVSQQPLRAGLPGWATLKITDAAGTPCTRLEPIMGNFAHFVAFHEDLQTIFHLHAAGLKDIVDPTLRSGPDVQVYLPGLKRGFVKLFAQVKIDGQVITAPFGLQVDP